MTFSRAFVTSQEGWDRSPAVTMHLNGDGLVILGFETNQVNGLEVGDRIVESRPRAIVGLEMEAKVRAEPARNCRMEISGWSDTISAAVKEGPKMLQARAGSSGKDIITMKTPCQTVAHVHEG